MGVQIITRDIRDRVKAAEKHMQDMGYFDHDEINLPVDPSTGPTASSIIRLEITYGLKKAIPDKRDRKKHS